MSYNINQGTVEVRESQVVRSQVYSSNTGANAGVNIEAGGVPVAQSVKTSQVQGQKVEDQEENDFYYTKERLNYIGWIKRLSFLAIVVAIAQIVLSSVHVASHALPLMIALIVGGVVFLAGSALYVHWSQKAAKTYGSTELFQPRATDNLTKVVFISGLLLSGVAVVGLVNLFMQRDYSLDFSEAQASTQDTWDNKYEGRTQDNVNGFFRVNFVLQGCFALFFFFYFLLASRAAFRCLKFDNQAMSYIVFLGNVLLLAFALGVIFFADHAFGYEEFPQIRSHFPIWNVRGLFFIAMFAAVVSIFGFLVDHRSWRVGFFVLSFLLLLILVFLVNFTGYAYRHARHTYEFYKGVSDESTCINRLQVFHEQELLDLGCPAKYESRREEDCPVGARLTRWEPTPTTAGNAAATPTPVVFADADFGDSLQFAAESNYVSCLNTNCCGLMGQGYTEPLLGLANFGLLATLAGCLVSIGCYYFWYVTWIDSARDKRKDFSWLGVMALIIITFLVVFFTVDLPYPSEQLGTDGRHL